MTDVGAVKKRGRPKIDGNAVLASGKTVDAMTASERVVVLTLLINERNEAHGAVPSTPHAKVPTSRREALKIERDRKQAVLDPLFDRGFRIAEAAAAANVSYADAQRARMLWQGKQALADRQRATLSPSARRVADVADRNTVGSRDAGVNAVSVEIPQPTFNIDETHAIIARLNATLDDSVIEHEPPETED